MEIFIKGEAFTLYHEKSMLWRSKKILFVADLHMGKAAHFRKAGIPIPEISETNNLKMLERVILKSKCEHLVVLGDMFHSSHNVECEKFLKWRSNFPLLQVSLVEGNHDILDRNFYTRANLNTMETLEIGPFIFTHKPWKKDLKALYNIAGHIHPGVKLKGKGRQSLSLPCFYFSQNNGIMPSFGSFTGSYMITPNINDQIYVVANSQIKKISV